MKIFKQLRKVMESVGLSRLSMPKVMPGIPLPPPNTFTLPDNLQHHHLGDRGHFRGRKHASTTGNNRRRARCLDGGLGDRDDKKPGHRWDILWREGKILPMGKFRCRRCGDEKVLRLKEVS